MTTRDYKSDNCNIDFNSSMTPEEAEAVIGKTISKVDASEYNLSITFSDGTTLDIQGHLFDGCAIGVDYYD